MEDMMMQRVLSFQIPTYHFSVSKNFYGRDRRLGQSQPIKDLSRVLRTNPISEKETLTRESCSFCCSLGKRIH